MQFKKYIFVFTFILTNIVFANLKVFADVLDMNTISAGNYANFAITNDGILYGWGSNQYGQIGDGTTEGKSFPVKIMKNVINVWSSNYITLAMTSDGSLWGWGLYQEPEGASFQYVPEKIMENVKSASAGQYHILIVKSDNTLWGLGWNDYGQLGQSEQEKYVEPIKIMEDVKYAVAGADHSIILKTNGGVVTFGNRVNWE